MGLFGRKTVYPGERSKLDLDFGTMMVLVFLTLVILQAFGIIFQLSSVKLGPIFIILAVVMSAGTTVAIVKKLGNDKEVTKKDVFAILVTALIALVLLFFLRDYVPEIFQQSLIQLQAIIGI